MNSKRVYYLMLGLIVLLVVGLIGGAYGANGLLEKQANELKDAKAKNTALSNQQIGLTQAKKDVQKYSDLEQIAKSVVPQDKDQAEAVREIVNIASANGVKLASVTFPPSALGGTTGSAVASRSSSTANNLSQLQPVKGIPEVYNLQITVQQDSTAPVPYNQFLSFLTGLENNRRTAQVSNITLTPDVKNRSLLTFNLTLDEYIKP
mgnify:CR=1 FL=1